MVSLLGVSNNSIIRNSNSPPGVDGVIWTRIVEGNIESEEGRRSYAHPTVMFA